MLNMENVWSQLDKMIAQTEDNSPNIVWILCRDCHQVKYDLADSLRNIFCIK